MQTLVKAADGELVTGSLSDWLAAVDLRPAERIVRRELEVGTARSCCCCS